MISVSRDRQNSENEEVKERQVVALAWSNQLDSYCYRGVMMSIEASGSEVRLLDMARCLDLRYNEEGRLIDASDESGILTRDAAEIVRKDAWHHSNAEDVMKGIHCVIFPGGWDISPTLYNEQKWAVACRNSKYCAERDVSDYILLSYCLEKNIPVLAVCRGMQMLSVVMGAHLIQDIPTWLEGKGITCLDVHGDPEKKVFKSHTVEVQSQNSLLCKLAGGNILRDVPSCHHQIVNHIEGTGLNVTGTHESHGIKIIEAVEKSDQSFCLGVQFHPEGAVRKVLESCEDASDFMEYEKALTYFRAIAAAGEAYSKREL